MAVSVSVGETTKNTQQGLSWTGPLRFVVRFLLLHLFCHNRLNPLFVPCLSALILPDSKRLSQGFDLCSSIQRLCLHLYLFTATTTPPHIHTRPNQAIPNTNLTISFLHSREHICFVLPHTCFLHFRHAFLRVCLWTTLNVTSELLVCVDGLQPLPYLDYGCGGHCYRWPWGNFWSSEGKVIVCCILIHMRQHWRIAPAWPSYHVVPVGIRGSV